MRGRVDEFDHAACSFADYLVIENKFYDLRHTGNQLANDEGASLRELMDRMGHSSTRAALIYLPPQQAARQATG